MKLRPFLIMGIITLTMLIGLVTWVKLIDPIPQSQVIQKSNEIQKPPTKPPLVIPNLVQRLNERNKTITSFLCDDVKVKVWQDGSRYNLSGKVCYEKQKRFRLQKHFKIWVWMLWKLDFQQLHKVTLKLFQKLVKF